MRMTTRESIALEIQFDLTVELLPSDPIVQSVDINKSTSYAGVAGGSAKDQPNVNSNFRTLVADPVFDGVNISIPRKVVKKFATSKLLPTNAEKTNDDFQTVGKKKKEKGSRNDETKMLLKRGRIGRRELRRVRLERAESKNAYKDKCEVREEGGEEDNRERKEKRTCVEGCLVGRVCMECGGVSDKVCMVCGVDYRIMWSAEDGLFVGGMDIRSSAFGVGGDTHGLSIGGSDDLKVDSS
ncbi:hypothetical protein Tco_0523804 [Tanacetum coccineum]